MVRRLCALQDVAEDTEHKDFLQAQRFVREILMRLRGTKEEAAVEPASIQIIHGHIDEPLPGAQIEPVPENGNGKS